MKFYGAFNWVSATKDIGNYLHISTHTVSRHLRNLCLKYKANNAIHLLFMHVSKKNKLNTHPALSHRENQIMCLLFLGMNSLDIAHELGISAATVRKHRENMLLKLEVRSIREAVTFFIKNNK